MIRDLNPEDLFVTQGKTKTVKHDLVRTYGLFNLSRELQAELMNVYLHHAEEKGEKDRFKMLVFLGITQNIQNFPFSVYQHFTSGQAYEFNMKWLEQYSG